MNKSIELLAPAANLQSGRAAINCGADAVYIGASKFGARVSAGNSLQDIAELINYAHLFGCKVYVTINTLLFDNEIPEVLELISRLSEARADGIIIQDTALIESDLPPVNLIASTQMHNYDPERIKFLDKFGFKRIILAREMPLEVIRELKSSVNSELEYFVHGALCVSFSGQCYMSFASGGRSANRGECAQPCRLNYSLYDENEKEIIRDKHLLSLKDLNLSARLVDLIDAGITSFKIEGRLKDESYVKNITAFYRSQLDKIISVRKDLSRSSSGYSRIPFEPDPEKTFNRGYTEYFINGEQNNIACWDSPKSRGKLLGPAFNLPGGNLKIDFPGEVRPGDGLCFINESGNIEGFSVNKTDGDMVILPKEIRIKNGTPIYRNHDIEFFRQVSADVKRKIRIKIRLEFNMGNLLAIVSDEDNITAEIIIEGDGKIPDNPEKFKETIIRQFHKTGNSAFEADEINLTGDSLFFLPISRINEIRRQLLEKLADKRITHFNISSVKIPAFDSAGGLGESNTGKFKRDYRLNITNNAAIKFYKKNCGGDFQFAPEYDGQTEGRILMECKYCIRAELGICLLDNPGPYTRNLKLVSDKKSYSLSFNCSECRMIIKKA